MRILSIETSCDETAVAIVEARGGTRRPSFQIMGDALYSQANLHAQYGGVYPNLAKREHGKNIIPLTRIALEQAGLAHERAREVKNVPEADWYTSHFDREPGVAEHFMDLISTIKKPKIDAIAVTSGPGLEPALWVGINVAKALAHAWDLPLVPVNHMEGHLFAALLQVVSKNGMSLTLTPPRFPLVGLLVSGGHTELVLAKSWMQYELLGATRDDAAGEAFDKVARILGLPYPGGPAISRLAASIPDGSSRFALPRPMLNSKDLDFSFSGLKTAVLYTVRGQKRLSDKMKAEIANEFENAAVEVLVSKTLRAAEMHDAHMIVVGGGVSANDRLRKKLTSTVKEKLPHTTLHIPRAVLSTDNAIMIAAAAYFRTNAKGGQNTTIRTATNMEALRAEGTMRIANN